MMSLLQTSSTSPGGIEVRSANAGIMGPVQTEFGILLAADILDVVLLLTDDMG